MRAPSSVVVVTGAGGFIGRAITGGLLHRGMAVRALSSRPGPPPGRQPPERDASLQWVTVADWSRRDALLPWLRGADAVVHLAARAHVRVETAPDPLAAFRKANRDLTRRLAELVAQAGVRRFVFMSSIGIHGNRTLDQPFRENDSPNPETPYARSKWEAEQALMEVAARSRDLETVVLRPPLVYGPGVGGNFLALLKLCSLGLPLPFGAIDNRRSLLFVDNLVDAAARCLEHPAAAGSTFLVSDGEALSTAELIRRLSAALGRTARLWPVPSSGLRALGWLTGRRAELDRLLNDLMVDDSRLRGSLAWRCPYSVDEGLAATARWYRDRASSAADAPAQ